MCKVKIKHKKEKRENNANKLAFFQKQKKIFLPVYIYIRELISNQNTKLVL